MELRPFATLELKLAGDRIFMLGTTPQGNRMIGEIAAAELVGSRITASMKGLAAADWATVGAQGLARFDIRILLEDAEGALIFLTYRGKADWSGGYASSPIYAVAEFETADERYVWLNAMQVVGKGEFTPDFSGVDYEFFELF